MIALCSEQIQWYDRILESVHVTLVSEPCDLLDNAPRWCLHLQIFKKRVERHVPIGVHVGWLASFVAHPAERLAWQACNTTINAGGGGPAHTEMPLAIAHAVDHITDALEDACVGVNHLEVLLALGLVVACRVASEGHAHGLASNTLRTHFGYFAMCDIHTIPHPS